MPTCKGEKTPRAARQAFASPDGSCCWCPLGMAVAGLSIGTGRHAYATAGGQLAVAVGLLAVAACWIWSGRIMRVPQPPRVFR